MTFEVGAVVGKTRGLLEVSFISVEIQGWILLLLDMRMEKTVEEEGSHYPH